MVFRLSTEQHDDDREKKLLGRATRPPTRVLHKHVRMQVIIKFSIPDMHPYALYGFLKMKISGLFGTFEVLPRVRIAYLRRLNYFA